MAWVFYKNFKLGQLDSAIHAEYPVDFDTGVIGILLLDAGSTIDQTDIDVQDVIAGASDSEVTGTNYARKDITGIDVVLSGNNADVGTAMSSPSYAVHASGFNDAKHAILYRTDGTTAIASGVDASSPLIAYNTFTSNLNNTSGSLTLQFNSSNIFTLS